MGRDLMKHNCLKTKIFYSNLNMEYFEDSDYTYTKGVCNDFSTKSLGKYHDLYLSSYDDKRI